jgi:hypothetical protein
MTDLLLENAVYDILDEGILNFDEILIRLNGRLGAVDEVVVFDLANAYLEHYGLCVEFV